MKLSKFAIAGFAVVILNGCSTTATVKKTQTNIYSMKEGREQLDINIYDESALQFDYHVPFYRHFLGALTFYLYPIVAYASEWDMTYKYSTLHKRTEMQSEVLEEGEIRILASESFVPVVQVPDIRNHFQSQWFREIIGRVNQARINLDEEVNKNYILLKSIYYDDDIGTILAGYPGSYIKGIKYVTKIGDAVSIQVDYPDVLSEVDDLMSSKGDADYVHHLIISPVLENQLSAPSVVRATPAISGETDYKVHIARKFKNKDGLVLGTSYEEYDLISDLVNQDKVRQKFIGYQ